MPKGILREAGSRPGYREMSTGRVGCPSHHLWLKAAGRGPGDYCCCPWHGWQLGRRAGSVELGGAAPWEGPGQEASQPVLQGGPRLFQVLLQMAGHRGGRQGGVRWDQQRRHWPQGPLSGAVIVGTSDFPPGSRGGVRYCTFIATLTLKLGP